MTDNQKKQIYDYLLQYGDKIHEHFECSIDISGGKSYVYKTVFIKLNLKHIFAIMVRKDSYYNTVVVKVEMAR